MKISIVSCVYHPEPVASARNSTDLAQVLSAQGHSVQVITTFPNRPAGKLYKGYRRKLWMREQTPDGNKVLRIFSFFSSESNLLSRFLENLSFGIASGVAIVVLEKPEVVYGNTWPIFAQGFLMFACKLRRTHLMLSVQDLYPESLFVQKRGFEKTSRLYTFLHWLDAQITRNCAGLIVIADQFKEIYVNDRRVPEEKISVIPNWINDSQQVTTPSDNSIREKHNIPADAFLVVYGGNIGAAAGVESLIEGFEHLLSQKNIYLLLAGAGSNLSNCLELIQQHQLDRVKIHSPWHSSDTYTVLSAADLCILPTQGKQSLVSVPSKLLSYMMAGRCVLALALPASETARIISDSQVGWVISANDAEALANSICEIAGLPSSERNRRGQAGRNFVLEHFSTSKNVSKVVELLVQQGKRSEQHPSHAT